MLDQVSDQSCALFEPPRPKPLGTMTALLRAAIRRDGNLIGLLPKETYHVRIGNLGYSRRSIVIINDVKAIRSIMTDPCGIFPKNDLMVGALAPLVGDSIFVSSGETWRRQREMVAPAFSHMKLSKAFQGMREAIDDFDTVLDDRSKSGEYFSLDFAMSQLTADIICRTVFSTALSSSVAREVFEAFEVFEESVAHVEIRRLIMEPAWSDIPHSKIVLDACDMIRAHLGKLVDGHLNDGASFKDIAADIITAKDNSTGNPFSREELIDQLGVFFLAGHETTASALTWGFYVLATRPDVLSRVRSEVEKTTKGEEIDFQHIRKLDFTRSVFKECLRLYPPITFIPRVASQATEICGRRIKKGAMVMIAPWVIHRHSEYWKNPHSFDAERFMSHREKEIVSDSYMPFGLGPRVCVGANFATIEATLILARLAMRYNFQLQPEQKIEPVARLTTRPKEQIQLKVERRN
ncbi:MAG: cytochrome P450 [Pseudomonadota bacterium]